MGQKSPAIQRLVEMREAGHVRRCHTMPHHGEYTVGKHSFDAVLILYALYPGEPSAALVKAVVMHDLGERWTGDVPAPAKWADGELAKRLGRLEARCIDHLGGMPDLTADERRWLHGVDSLELMLWAKDQLALGNMAAATFIGALKSHLETTDLPDELKELVEHHQWERTMGGMPK